MDSLNDIINKMSNIANSMGYTGPTVDAIVYLAANSIYINEMNAITAILEASPSRCKLTNSAIQHAKDIGLSVNRGTNKHIIFNSIIATETKSYKKFEQAAKVGTHYLYFANDVNTTSGSPATVEFIVGKNVIEEVIKVGSNLDLMRLKSVKTNYSNDISFSRANNSNNTELNFTEIKRDIFDINSNINYWITTTTDYGLEVYIFPNDVSSNEVTQFKAGESYKLRGIEYLDEDKDIDDIKSIKSIPGFILNENSYNNAIVSEKEERTSDPTKIYKDSLKLSNSSFVIRSADDIKNAIMAVNNSIKACNIIVTAPSTDGLEDTDLSSKSLIKVIYLTNNLEDNEGISAIEMDAIEKKLKKSYYVTQKFEFKTAEGYKVVDEKEGELRKYRLYLTVFYNSNFNRGSIEEYIRSFNYSIGTRFEPEKIKGGLVSNFPEISYVSYQQLIYGDENDSDTDVIELGDNQFIDFELKVNYKSAI